MPGTRYAFGNFLNSASHMKLSHIALIATAIAALLLLLAGPGTRFG
jgi:hypothetical protein